MIRKIRKEIFIFRSCLCIILEKVEVICKTINFLQFEGLVTCTPKWLISKCQKPSGVEMSLHINTLLKVYIKLVVNYKATRTPPKFQIRNKGAFIYYVINIGGGGGTKMLMSRFCMEVRMDNLNKF